MSDLVIPTLASAPASSIKKKPAVKATLIDSTVGGDKPSFGDVPMECITASKTNPRKIFDDAALADLAASISKHGVAQPILLRPTHVDAAGVTFFEVVAGERRFRASKLAGKTTVPAIVRNLSDAEALEIQVIENLQRQDLHPLEEAEGFEVLMRENGYTADVMAEKTGKSKAYIYASLKLTALEPSPRAVFYSGRLNKSTALLVARIPIKSLQEKCVGEIAGEQRIMSARDAARHIERNYMLDLTKAPFDRENGALNPGAGACSTCHLRTGNQPEVFSDVSADVCTDPICFKAKNDEHVVRVLKLAKENGQAVITGAAAKKIKEASYSAVGGGYVELDKVNHFPGQNGRTFRQILGDVLPKPTLLETPGTAEIVEIVKAADIAHLLKEKGVTLNVKGDKIQSEHDAREKEAERKAKLEREYRNTLFTEVHHASLMANLVDADLRVIAGLMFNQLPGGTLPKKLVMDLHGWTEETLGHSDYRGNLRRAVDALTPAQLNQFIRDCALSHELHVYAHTHSSKDDPHNLLAAAKRVKVDAYSIKTQINEAAKAKAKAKADAAKYAADKKAQAASKKADKANKASLENIEQLTPEQVPAFLTDFPDRLNELTEFALESRPLFIALIEQWAIEAGHQYCGDGFVKLGTIASSMAAPLPGNEGAASDEDEEDAEMLAEDIGLNAVIAAAEEPAARAPAEPAPQSATPAPRARKPKTTPAPGAWPFPKSPAAGATTPTPDTEAAPQ
ncbi:ParB/RepB/Spo0J family partition protein [Janthinobacterium sp. MDB2-8]|uniref:ParB/RepB/Spo0J family partition protein n=1 Tax=Janthinobacterium sp. MDB2-8 TaxID=1259338 RepID=UPI003F27EC37